MSGKGGAAPRYREGQSDEERDAREKDSRPNVRTRLLNDGLNGAYKMD